MKILNIMLSPHLGGIEHSSVSWSCILTAWDIKSHLIRANADIKTRLKKNIFHSKSAFKDQWNPLFYWQYHRLLQQIKPHLVIVHG